MGIQAEKFTEDSRNKARNDPSFVVPTVKRKRGTSFFMQLVEDTAMSFASDMMKQVVTAVIKEVVSTISSSYMANQRMTPELYKELYLWCDAAGIFGLSAVKHKRITAYYDHNTDTKDTYAEVPDGTYRSFKNSCFISCELGTNKEKNFWGGDVSDKFIVLKIFGPENNLMDYQLKAIIEKSTRREGLRVYDIDNPWKAHNRELRGLDSIVLQPELRAKLVHHLDWWKSSKEMHVQYGLAYKTVLLLHGPPGTGKTTLAQAVAKHLGYDLALVKIDPAKMVEVKDKITGARKKTVLLIEDVDRAVAIPKKKEEAPKTAATTTESTQTPPPANQEVETDRPIQGIEHLMNALDGVMSPEGVVVIMTTNHKDRLDPALIRKGRVNLDLLLDLFDWERAVEMGRLFGFGEDVVKSYGEAVWSVPAELQQRLMQEILKNSVEVADD